MSIVDLRAQRADYTPPPVQQPEPQVVEIVEEFVLETGADPFFPVRIAPLISVVNQEATDIRRTNGDLQAVIGQVSDDGYENILAVHGNRYRLITNQTVAQAYDNAVEHALNNNRFSDSFAAMGKPTIENYLGDEGARMIRTYNYPQTSRSLLPDMPVRFEVRLLNSYNGTFKMGIVAGARTYGTHSFSLVWGNTTVQQFGKHTAGINLHNIISRIHEAYTSYVQECESVKPIEQLPITSDTAQNLIMNNLGIATDSNCADILSHFTRFSLTYGVNALSLYLALSYWATADTNSANSAVIRFNRETQVRKLLRSNAWRTLSESAR